MGEKDQQKFAEGLLQYLNDSPTAYHAVENGAAILRAHGFTQLKETDRWSLKKGGRYFMTRNSSGLIAFTVGEESLEENGFRIIGCHTDSPGLKIKPGPCTVTPDGYVKVNVEVYGGAVLSTWFDRPLAMAGRVIVKKDGGAAGLAEERLIKIEEPVFVLPSLCIHLHKKTDDNNNLNRQTELLPILAMKEEGVEKGDYLLRLLRDKAGIDPAAVLDYELFLYEYEKGIFTGGNREFISASRLDDLSMVYAGLSALAESCKKGAACRVLAAFDNEEVGSTTAQGAHSGLLLHTLNRICKNLGLDDDGYFRAIAHSTSISADLAHAVHPNYSDRHDPENHPVLGGGPVIKYSASQRYATTAFTAAYFMEACERAGVAFQQFVNRNDIPGGSTIGPVMSGLTTIPAVDMGTPILAMHSIREFGAVTDQYDTWKAFLAYYEGC